VVTSTIEEPAVKKALFQFIFPFALEKDCQDDLWASLTADDYVPFQVDRLELENLFYGPNNRVSHRDMERYFLPFTNHFLFPDTLHPDGFRRLSKPMNIQAKLFSQQLQFAFTVYSVDLFLCPFDTGFLTIRVEVTGDGELNFSQTMEFADRMRHLQDANILDRNTYIEHEGKGYDEVEDFVFKSLIPHLPDFLDRSSQKGTHFEKLPFLMDERMFVIGFCAFPEDTDISLIHRYRAARLDGLDPDGNPRLGASHIPYMEKYCEQYEYDRWAPDTYYLTDETCFMCLTRGNSELITKLSNQMYGEYYYVLILNLFHRIVLLKLSIAYSQAQLERKQEQIEDLIRDITKFSAKYYFFEVVSQNQGREIFHQQRLMYGNDELFEDVKETLNDLYKYQENRTSKQSSYLLTILTIYTVISGIYGMNQVIEDLKGDFNWSFIQSYSSFQWIALIVTFSGLFVAFLLVIGILWQWGRDYSRRHRKRK
jgi:hypothetical protein